MVSPKSESPTEPDKSVKMDLAPVVPDSFRRTGFIERWRFWLPPMLVLGLAIWRVADDWQQDIPGTSWHSPGPLASAHVLYDSQCGACHTDFVPVSATNWLATGVGKTHAADARCTECHESLDHHANEKPEQTPGCTACHVEHRGRDTSLLRSSDGQCTSCHADLRKNLADKASTAVVDVANVGQFNKASHPEFRIAQSPAADPRRLKFNHKLHLTPGFRRTEGGESFTLDKVDPRYRSLYGSGDQPRDPVQLECKSCHQLDSRDFMPPPDVLGDVPRNAVTPARPPGATMLPIVYERHCQACHPLTFERAEGANVDWQAAVVPHRQQPGQIRRFLDAFFLDRLQKSNPDLLQRPFPPLPGKPAAPEQRVLADVLSERVRRAEQQLYLGKKVCGECHYSTPAPEQAQPDQLKDLKIEPTQVPEVWFQGANFTHTPHRLLDCLECHPGADSRQELERRAVGGLARRVLLPGIDNCLSCHSPSSPGGGARHDCVACHRYHDGTHPLSGAGAAVRAGRNAGKRSIREFIDATGP
jgi:predicted CXXCH cytochrome family protein